MSTSPAYFGFKMLKELLYTITLPAKRYLVRKWTRPYTAVAILVKREIKYAGHT